ncbi:MAG TPA: TraR/DksA C4-type zinc finger protein [Alphaproteobacteria bacterium]|nr:TraR/DksA C4-type zinc finger protein [Alphaproteobacteria bacterium]
MTSHTELKARLEQRLNELASHLEQLEDQLRRPVSKSFDEQPLERESDEVLEDLEEVHIAEMAATRGALARLEEGTYGICISCGKNIAPARLEAMPTAALCIECANEQEQQR